MRLATIRIGSGATAAVVVDGDRLVELGEPDVGAVLADPAWRTRRPAAGAAAHAVDDADFAPLVTRPSKIVCVGLNYRSHIIEMGRELPAHPTLFAKFADTLLGAHDDLVLPPESTSVDWEVELGIVIGAQVRRVGEAEALDAIAGYTVINDVSMRDWQNRTIQFLQGKAWDRSTPVGPTMATFDELGDPSDLLLTCSVNGVEMQSGRTSDLLFGPAEIVAYVSQFTTLRPGDLIATGTPGGVGAGRKPPVFLQAGDVLTTTVEGIGTCTNRCVADA